MSRDVVEWAVLGLILILNVADVIHTWRVAHGRSTRRSRLFKGALSEEMTRSDRAWQEANRAMFPGTVAMTLLLVLFLMLGIVLDIDWSMPVILLLAVGAITWNKVVGTRAAEKAEQ